MEYKQWLKYWWAYSGRLLLLLALVLGFGLSTVQAANNIPCEGGAGNKQGTATEVCASIGSGWWGGAPSPVVMAGSGGIGYWCSATGSSQLGVATCNADKCTTGGATYDQNKGECTCPTGQELINNKCVAQCQNGQIRDALGACVCPDGQTCEPPLPPEPPQCLPPSFIDATGQCVQDTCAAQAAACQATCSLTGVKEFSCTNNVVTKSCTCMAEDPPPDPDPTCENGYWGEVNGQTVCVPSTGGGDSGTGTGGSGGGDSGTGTGGTGGGDSGTGTGGTGGGDSGTGTGGSGTGTAGTGTGGTGTGGTGTGTGGTGTGGTGTGGTGTGGSDTGGSDTGGSDTGTEAPSTCAMDLKNPDGSCYNPSSGGKGGFDSGAWDTTGAKTQLNAKYTEVKNGFTNAFKVQVASGAGSLPCFPSVQILNTSVNLCFTQYEDQLRIIGNAIFAMSFVLAALIVIGGKT